MAQDFVYVRRALQGLSVRSVYPAICGTMAANVSRTTNLPTQLPTVLPPQLCLSLLSLSDSSLSLSLIPELWLEECAAHAQDCLDKYRPNPLHEPTQYTKPFDSLTEPAFHTRCGCVNNVISAGALYGSNREKAMARQDACCSVTQLSSHVAHQQNNSWVNIDCLTGCLWSVWVAITPSPVRNRTMSSNNNIF